MQEQVDKEAENEAAQGQSEGRDTEGGWDESSDSETSSFEEKLEFDFRKGVESDDDATIPQAGPLNPEELAQREKMRESGKHVHFEENSRETRADHDDAAQIAAVTAAVGALEVAASADRISSAANDPVDRESKIDERIESADLQIDRNSAALSEHEEHAHANQIAVDSEEIKMKVKRKLAVREKVKMKRNIQKQRGKRGQYEPKSRNGSNLRDAYD